MKQTKIMDHLFRHQYGRMVSILTRIFGLTNLETIEDAVQDTFIKAMQTWRSELPENPEAWLTKAAKNRAIDLLRKIRADQNRILKLENGPASMVLNDLFLDHEIEDSQLRMIFTACHPNLNSNNQIAFALKTISGFSIKEIAAALLLKEETVKKRLFRARKELQNKEITFEIPNRFELPNRIDRVLEVLYLIFNEGFHSTQNELLIRRDLCTEAMRLCKFLLKKEELSSHSAYALFALMCFHAARLESKVDEKNEMKDLKSQDRSKWHFPLIFAGNDAMNKAVENATLSTYHYEAAIAAEHVKATSFESTDWNRILFWYKKLYDLQNSDFTLLNMVMVYIQLKKFEMAEQLLDSIDPDQLEQRAYLYFGTYSELFHQKKQLNKAINYLEKAIGLVNNQLERAYLQNKMALLENS